VPAARSARRFSTRPASRPKIGTRRSDSWCGF
jgi:hypothetical protein